MVPAALQLFVPAGFASSNGGNVSFEAQAARYMAYATRAAAGGAAVQPAAATHRDHALLDDAGGLACVLMDLEARSISSRAVQPAAALIPEWQQLLQPDMLYSIKWVAAALADDLLGTCCCCLQHLQQHCS